MTTTGKGPFPRSGVYSQPRTVSPPLLNSMSRLIRGEGSPRSLGLVDQTVVARLVEAGRPGIAPDHEDRLVTGVLEPVVVVLGHEDDLAGPELDIGVTYPRDPVTGDEVLELLRVRVPVDVVLRAWREDGDPEDRVLGAHGFAGEQPAHVHVLPAVLRAQCGVSRL